MEKKFSAVAMTESNPKWEAAIARSAPLFKSQTETRSEFFRDYTRILHSTGFRRLKHKTQVFFSPQSDHICTRIEHVLHVESIALSIADSLGLNQELVRSIAVGHDLGHSPFGHKGEKVLDKILIKHAGERFWHERNSLFFVDHLELLENHDRHKYPLNLTYAVRDGLICHCGENAKNHLRPRLEAVDLYSFTTPGIALPFTFEGCVVRMADRISYIGRDIEDARSLGILDAEKMELLTELLSSYTGDKVNNTIIINSLVQDLCSSSDPDAGICFSENTNSMLRVLSEFNVKNIYQKDRVTRADLYFELVLTELFSFLFSTFDGPKTLGALEKRAKEYPAVVAAFRDWLSSYWTLPRPEYMKNEPVFDIYKESDYARACVLYIAGMTDKFAIDSYNQIISF